MLTEMTYSCTTSINLHLEWAHKAGLTPVETKEIIGKISDPYSTFTCAFRPEPAGLNHNLVVETNAADVHDVRRVVQIIERHLVIALADEGIDKYIEILKNREKLWQGLPE